MSQKESEWELELRDMIDGIAAYKHDVGDRAVLLVKKVISNREKEIAEEVEKKRKEPTHSGTGSISWYNQALDEVLLIIKK